MRPRSNVPWRVSVFGSIVSLLVCGLAIAGAGPGAGAAGPLRVVATTTQVADFARNAVGTAAHVEGILAANVDPHDYEPVPGDLKKIASADIILENGVGLESGWMNKLLQSKRKGVRIIDTSRGIAIREGSKENPQGDPHIWFAVPNASRMVVNIRDGMASVDPQNAATYRANASNYIKQLDELDKYIFRQIATLPRAQRKLVTTHDAFGYYVSRYGVTLVGAVIPSTSTEAQASAKHLSELVALIKRQHVKAVFLETSVNPKLGQQIAREAGVKVVYDLYGDTLGPVGSTGETYIKMMRHNTDLIVSSLR